MMRAPAITDIDAKVNIGLAFIYPSYDINGKINFITCDHIALKHVTGVGTKLFVLEVFAVFFVLSLRALYCSSGQPHSDGFHGSSSAEAAKRYVPS